MPERDGYVGPTMEEEGVSSMVLQREAWYRWAGTGGQVQVGRYRCLVQVGRYLLQILMTD